MSFSLPLGRPAVMGILNVTPDSFSDGGRVGSVADALAEARAMMAEGADLIDVGGESTRPGSGPVDLETELLRTVEVVAALAREGIPVSVDTRKAEVARRCLAAGASVVNDVEGLRDPEMRAVCAAAGATVCLMHMQGQPSTMQEAPDYPGGVVPTVVGFLAAAAAQAERDGIARERIWLDPGIGFGKTLSHNLELLRRLPELVALGYPVLVGVSRKGFLGRIAALGSEPLPVGERLEAGLAVQVLAQANGARVLRTHDVRATRRAAEAAGAVLQSLGSAAET